MDCRMQRCAGCGSYTLSDQCPRCGARTAQPHPPRFSPEDRYGHYRRRLKKLAAEEARP